MWGGRRRGSNFGLLLLAGQLYQLGLNTIPPITLAVVGVCTAVFLNPLHWHLPSISKIGLLPARVWFNHEVSRIFVAPFFHLGDIHLFYNMSSMLYKGRQLEPLFGRKRFVLLIVLFVVAAGAIHTLAAFLLDFFDTQFASEFHTTAVGFSAVLFALKVVLTHMTPNGPSFVMGFPVPSKYVYWAELLLIQLLVPGTSFLGHLSGILAGLMYVNGLFRPFFAAVDAMESGPQRTPVTYRGAGASGTTRARVPPEDSRHQPTPRTWMAPPTVPAAASRVAAVATDDAESRAVLRDAAAERDLRLRAAEARQARQ